MKISYLYHKVKRVHFICGFATLENAIFSTPDEPLHILDINANILFLFLIFVFYDNYGRIQRQDPLKIHKRL